MRLRYGALAAYGEVEREPLSADFVQLSPAGALLLAQV